MSDSIKMVTYSATDPAKVPEDQAVLMRLTMACITANIASKRHKNLAISEYVRDCLLPAIAEHGLTISVQDNDNL